MARLDDDSPLKGLRGRLANLIVRQVMGKGVVQSAPVRQKKPAPRSPRQQQQNERMRRASAYANTQKRDPAAIALYAPRIDADHTSVYTVALTDCLNPPVVRAVDAGAYRGQVGDALRIRATDDSAVVKVWVELGSAAGREAGWAEPLGGDEWLYRLRQTHTVGPGSTRLLVRAYDRPDNTGELELSL